MTGGGGAVVNWLGGGGRASSAQCRPRRVWGHAPPDFFFINLIEYGVSFCLLKYKKSKFVLVKTKCRWHAVVRCVCVCGGGGGGSGFGGSGSSDPLDPPGYGPAIDTSFMYSATLGREAPF